MALIWPLVRLQIIELGTWLALESIQACRRWPFRQAWWKKNRALRWQTIDRKLEGGKGAVTLVNSLKSHQLAWCKAVLDVITISPGGPLMKASKVVLVRLSCSNYIELAMFMIYKCSLCWHPATSRHCFLADNKLVWCKATYRQAKHSMLIYCISVSTVLCLRR